MPYPDRVITVDVDTTSVSQIRIAPSPAHEVVSWLKLVASGRHHPVFGDPGQSARRLLADRDVALVARVLPTGAGYTPDMLTPKPPPGPAARTFAAQLERTAETPLDEVAFQLREVRFPGGRMPADVRAALESGSFAERAAAGLRKFGQFTLAQQWGRVQAALDRDIAHRSNTLAERGVGHVLTNLHAAVRWIDNRLELQNRYDGQHSLTKTDLVLAPTVLGWPQLTIQVCNPTDAVITYPASGFGRPSAGSASDVAALLGASRAAMLVDLDVPRSTSQLSARHNLSPATVSHHLGVLTRAGLLVRIRRQRVVFYQRSPGGDQIVVGAHHAAS